MKPIINHFTDNDLYTFTCQYYILKTYPRAEVEYTFYDRNHQVYPQGFDKLLREANVVGTPGEGFGPCGEGYFRLTAFGGREDTEKAVARIREKLHV